LVKFPGNLINTLLGKAGFQFPGNCRNDYVESYVKFPGNFSNTLLGQAGFQFPGKCRNAYTPQVSQTCGVWPRLMAIKLIINLLQQINHQRQLIVGAECDAVLAAILLFEGNEPGQFGSQVFFALAVGEVQGEVVITHGGGG